MITQSLTPTLTLSLLLGAADIANLGPALRGLELNLKAP
jgi:hypothetical protein